MIGDGAVSTMCMRTRCSSCNKRDDKAIERVGLPRVRIPISSSVVGSLPEAEGPVSGPSSGRVPRVLCVLWLLLSVISTPQVVALRIAEGVAVCQADVRDVSVQNRSRGISTVKYEA